MRINEIVTQACSCVKFHDIEPVAITAAVIYIRDYASTEDKETFKRLFGELAYDCIITMTDD